MDIDGGLGSSPSRALRTSLVRGIVLAAAVAAVSFGPQIERSPTLGLLNVMVVVAFASTGLVLRAEPDQRGSGGALLVSAGCYLVSWWWCWPPPWQVGPVALLSYVGGYLWFVAGVYALLRYPEAGLARWWDRAYVWLLAGCVVVPKLVLATVSRPGWVDGRFAAGAWWPTIAPNPALFAAGSQVAKVGLVAVAVLVLVPLLLKVRRSRSVDRIDAVPGMVAAATVMLFGSAYLLAQYGSLASATVDLFRGAIGVAALFTPIAFLTSALQRRLARASLADLIVRLVDAPDPVAVQEELRHSLPDPTLAVWFWLPDRGEFVDVDEHRSAAPHDQGSFTVDVRGRDRQPLAVLVLDPALRRHPKLVAPAVAACRFALENTRLQADLRAQLQELQAAATRLTQAESNGRRQIERDLHDGAQQTLWAARMSLGEARRAVAPGTTAHDAILQAQTDLGAATDELRQLARGISPPILTQSGLRPALEGVIARLDASVECDIPTERYDAAVESTTYFVVCEALTNAVKHAAATTIRVAIRRRDDELAILVTDDGSGGVREGTGTGLTSIGDRARAIGGTMTMRSPEGRGTRMEVVVPCG